MICTKFGLNSPYCMFNPNMPSNDLFLTFLDLRMPPLTLICPQMTSDSPMTFPPYSFGTHHLQKYLSTQTICKFFSLKFI